MDDNQNQKGTPSQEFIYETSGGCCMLIVCLFLIFTLPPIGFIMIGGLFTLQPNEGVVLTLCGSYRGSVRKSGYHWCNPFYQRQPVSLRSNNLNGNIITVNDKAGNPILIAAVVLWRVHDTAKAIFDVNDYMNFVAVQYESAVRHLALSFPYDTATTGGISLRSGHEEVTRFLKQEMKERLDKAGIDVEEARITTLSYAPEIAGTMLRRQQAEAIIGSRQKIVEGAVNIIGSAIEALKDNGIVNLNQDEKSKLVSNLLVVLCSEGGVQPVLNTGQ